MSYHDLFWNSTNYNVTTCANIMMRVCDVKHITKIYDFEIFSYFMHSFLLLFFFFEISVKELQTNILQVTQSFILLCSTAKRLSIYFDIDKMVGIDRRQ